MYRQGDVLLVPVDALPKQRTRVPRDGGRIVLAYGEVTGHAHAIAEQHAELVTGSVAAARRGRTERATFLLADGDVVLRHEEHAPIAVAAGAYRVIRQREFRDGGAGYVVD